MQPATQQKCKKEKKKKKRKVELPIQHSRFNSWALVFPPQTRARKTGFARNLQLHHPLAAGRDCIERGNRVAFRHHLQNFTFCGRHRFQFWDFYRGVRFGNPWFGEGGVLKKETNQRGRIRDACEFSLWVGGCWGWGGVAGGGKKGVCPRCSLTLLT